MIRTVDIDECASNHCLNGGACSQGIDLYNCACAIGYTGLQCERNNTDHTYYMHIDVLMTINYVVEAHHEQNSTSCKKRLSGSTELCGFMF